MLFVRVVQSAGASSGYGADSRTLTSTSQRSDSRAARRTDAYALGGTHVTSVADRSRSCRSRTIGRTVISTLSHHGRGRGGRSDQHPERHYST